MALAGNVVHLHADSVWTLDEALAWIGGPHGVRDIGARTQIRRIRSIAGSSGHDELAAVHSIHKRIAFGPIRVFDGVSRLVFIATRTGSVTEKVGFGSEMALFVTDAPVSAADAPLSGAEGILSITESIQSAPGRIHSVPGRIHSVSGRVLSVNGQRPGHQ